MNKSSYCPLISKSRFTLYPWYLWVIFLLIFSFTVLARCLAILIVFLKSIYCASWFFLHHFHSNLVICYFYSCSLILWDRVSFSVCWPQAYYVSEVSLELLIILFSFTSSGITGMHHHTCLKLFILLSTNVLLLVFLLWKIVLLILEVLLY